MVNFIETHLNAWIAFLNDWNGDYGHWIQEHTNVKTLHAIDFCFPVCFSCLSPGNVQKLNIWIKRHKSPKVDVALDFSQSIWEEKWINQK